VAGTALGGRSGGQGKAVDAGGAASGGIGGAGGVSTIQEQLIPILQRLAPY
jgi:hypothetical protein